MHKILQDYQEADEFLLLFPARPINGLMGQFVLACGWVSTGEKTAGIAEVALGYGLMFILAELILSELVCGKLEIDTESEEAGNSYHGLYSIFTQS